MDHLIFRRSSGSNAYFFGLRHRVNKDFLVSACLDSKEKGYVVAVSRLCVYYFSSSVLLHCTLLCPLLACLPQGECGVCAPSEVGSGHGATKFRDGSLVKQGEPGVQGPPGPPGIPGLGTIGLQVR